MTVRKLQNECERWGIRMSGTRQELQDRLLSLFQGHPIAQKGCTKQFVMLQEDAVMGRDCPIFEEPSSASTSVETSVKGKKVQSEPKHRAANVNDEPTPSTTATNEDGRFFRSSARERGQIVLEDMEARRHVAPAHTSSKTMAVASSEEPTSSKLRLPHEVGQVLPGVPCKHCGHDMVLRENRINGNRFFGCSTFGRSTCRFTIDFSMGVNMAKEAASLR